MTIKTHNEDVLSPHRNGDIIHVTSADDMIQMKNDILLAARELSTYFDNLFPSIEGPIV